MCFEKLGVMVDCSRNSVMTVSALKKLIDVLSGMGYNTIQLYTEDTYEVEGEPYFGYLRGRYSRAELKEVDAYAKEKGMELFPCIQTLAHLKKIFRWHPYWGINDTADILLAENPRTEELIENIFRSLSQSFTSRRVNIGMDEAHLLGLGKYLDLHGYSNRVDIMVKHLKKVAGIAEKYGFRCMMWGDMFFRLAFGGNYYVDEVQEIPAEVLEKLPDNVDLIYWDYYSTDKARYKTMIKGHQALNKNTLFAGGGWTWTGLTPNNRYALAATKAAFAACKEEGVKEAFITLWGDDGGSCSPFSVLPTLFTAAKLAEGVEDEELIKEEFEKRFGIPFDTFLYADLPNMLYRDQPLESCNPAKYLLYNDTLLGMFDSFVDVGMGEAYKAHAEKLAEAERYEEWSFVFRPLRLLCEALYYKTDLGVKTRDLYRQEDRTGIGELVGNAYMPLIDRLTVFYEVFREYWHGLFKPHGFEVTDYRIGGLIFRLKHVAEKLTAYSQGKIGDIPELDEEILDYLGGVSEKEKKAISYNSFNTTVTVNSL